MVLQRKSRGCLIHVSDLINEEDRHLVEHNSDGEVIREARTVIYPGSNGDAWWDTKQLLIQIQKTIEIFDAAHLDCQALFIFDQPSAHASLGDDALKAFEMNKSNGGKQWKQKDMIVPNNAPAVHMHGHMQKMMTDRGEAKGLKDVLEEQGFSVSKMWAKCLPVCPFENTDCCMACLLSHQGNFVNQISMLEELISKAGHLCLFLPKFHCDLNPIKMVCLSYSQFNFISSQQDHPF